jgi:hypothetical protein
MKRFHYFDQLPSLHNLKLEACEDYQANYSDPPAKRLSRIRKIHIGHVDMSGEMIATIVGMSKELEVLEYSTFGLSSTDGGHSRVSSVMVGKVLSWYWRSLRVLDLDALLSADVRDDDFDVEGVEGVEGVRSEEGGKEKWGGDVARGEEYPDGSIGRLDGFDALTHLSIVSFPLPFLLSVSY